MTISEQTFAALMRDLGDADAPPPVDRSVAIARRAARIRRRRTMIAVGAVVAVVIATAGGAYAVNRPSPRPPVTSLVDDGMPASFTESDGTTYQRLAALTLKTSTQSTTSVVLPASAGPVAIVLRCPDGIGVRDGVEALFSLTGAPSPNAGRLDCPLSGYMPSRAVAGLPTHTQILELDPTTTQPKNRRPTLTIELTSRVPVAVVFGIYSWHVPSHPEPALAVPPMPTTDGHWALHKEYFGVWPSRTSVTVIIPKGVRWGMLNACPDVLTGADPDQTEAVGKLTLPLNGLRVVVNGEVSQMSPCRNAAALPSKSVGNEWTAKAVTTVTLTMAYSTMYRVRTGTWAVGIYYYEK
jgi:hypothetical protein